MQVLLGEKNARGKNMDLFGWAPCSGSQNKTRQQQGHPTTVGTQRKRCVPPAFSGWCVLTRELLWGHFYLGSWLLISLDTQLRLEVVFVWDVCWGQLSCHSTQEVEKRRPRRPSFLPEARPSIAGSPLSWEDLGLCSSSLSWLGYHPAYPGNVAASVHCLSLVLGLPDLPEPQVSGSQRERSEVAWVIVSKGNWDVGRLLLSPDAV